MKRFFRFEMTATIIVVLVAGLLLSPQLDSGFIGDDAINAMHVQRAYTYLGETVWESTAAAIRSWMQKEGRLFPLSGYVYAMFYILDGNLIAYKILMLLLVLVNIWLLGVLVRRVSGSFALGLMATLAAPLTIQFRAYHDAVLAFAGLLPLVTLWTLVSLLLLERYLRHGSRAALAGSLLAHAASLLTYEITIPFFLLHFILAFIAYSQRNSTSRLRRSLFIASPFAGLSVAAIAASVALRLVFHAPIIAGASTGPYAPRFDAIGIVTVMAKQVYAALPLSYYAAVRFYTDFVLTPVRGATTILDSPWGYIGSYPWRSTAVIIVLLLGIAACWRAFTREAGGRDTPANLRPVWWTSLLLTVLPGAMIAFSPKFQTEVYWGVGYLPVFVAAMGTAMLTAAAGYTLLKSRLSARFPHIVKACVAVSITLVGLLSYHNNRMVVEFCNRDFLYPRTVAESALQRGILSNVPDGSRLVVHPARPWDTPVFYAIHAGKRLSSVTPTGAPTSTGSTADDVYFFSVGSKSAQGGYAVAGRLRDITLREGAVASVSLDRVRTYQVTDDRWRFEPVTVGEWPYATPRPPRRDRLEDIGLNPAQLQLKESGNGWVIRESDARRVITIRP